MRLRADHVAGAGFVVFGVLLYALSGDLPFGTLRSPGAGMLPKLATALMMIFGLALILGARESEPFAAIPWDDLKHAALVLAMAAAAVACYTRLGFLITMTLLLFGLVAGVERRNPLAAAVFSVCTAVGAYLLFRLVLKAPLEPGILWGVAWF